MNNCGVCCEKTNKTTRKEVKCNYCDYSSCRQCVEHYLLDSVDNHCMNCKKVWSNDFIDSAFTKVFVNNKLRTHTNEILLSEQKALLPETMPNATAEKNIRQLKKEHSAIWNNVYLLREQINRLITQADSKNREIGEQSIIRNGISHNKEVAKFVRKCPVENCKGFLSTRWKCEMCDSHICNKCNESITLNHECDPEKVSTMELLSKDTKPCPNCGTLICKIPGGCDQMWCVDCHTAFSWNKGIIEKGIVHNPHYYEFLRNNSTTPIPRNPGEYCDNQPFPYIRMLINHLHFNKINKDLNELLTTIHNVCTHIQYGINNGNLADYPGILRNMRISFLLNEIPEEEWKISIGILNRKRQKYTDFRNINTMFVNVIGDYLNNIISTNQELILPLILNTIDSIKELVKYHNDSIKNIGKKYSCVYPCIIVKKNQFMYYQNAKNNK
jgi:hypothetical protein